MLGGTTLIGVWVAAAPASAADIAHRLDQLRSPVRVLYVAAHPDDENTQLLTYLVRGRKVRAGYLSLTRGDGGQNLIGAEQRPLLGVIRTHELLAARRLDGAEQWFTSLRDFGFSKSSEETLRIWGDESALEDVVRVFRTFRPHVVITRFPEEGQTHGHHLASALLARLAFAASGDASRFPDQLNKSEISPWKPKRLFYNFPHFWARRGREPPPGPRYDIDIGGYDPWLGRSFGEVSAASRSMHKSQGFGASARIGPWTETLILLEGDPPPARDPFGGLEAWTSLEGGSQFKAAVEAAYETFSGSNPGRLVQLLSRAHHEAEKLQDQVLRQEVRAGLEELLVQAAGLFLEARCEHAEVSPGGKRTVQLRALVRAQDAEVVLHRVTGPGFDITPRQVLRVHELWTETAQLQASSGAEPTRPHWLELPPEEARYRVREPSQAIRPVIAPSLYVSFELGIGGLGLVVHQAVRRHWVDPVLGERTEDLQIAPPVSITPEVTVLYVPRGKPARLDLDALAGPEGFEGSVTFEGGAEVDPSTVALQLDPGESVRRTLSIRAESEMTLKLRFAPKGGKPQTAWTHQVVDYAHLPRTTMRSPAEVQLSPVQLEVPEGVYGYIPGSGDRVAELLARAGLRIETLDDRALQSGNLSRYRGILVGIRAFNVNEHLLSNRSRLMDYVKLGGTLVVQYNTKNWSSALPLAVGPYPLVISRARVTDETAEVRFLAPEHPVLTTPHRIGPQDFANWVQERGLYFAESWSSEYTPLFSMNDKGAKPEEGSTLWAGYGRGIYIFSGLSFFRQLPAGNPGAIRLLVNFLAARGERKEEASR